jgi:group I intron endonuclease
MVIYKVTNLINNMIYIGQTSKSLENRRYHHYKTKRETKFGKALKEHKVEDFSWEIIDTCISRCDMDNKEKYYISIFNSCLNGYNSTKGGSGGDTRSGHKSSPEHLLKMSIALKNHIVSEDAREKISNKLKENFKNNPPFNKNEIQDMVQLYTEGKSLRFISYKYNTDHHKIKRIINCFGEEKIKLNS